MKRYAGVGLVLLVAVVGTAVFFLMPDVPEGSAERVTARSETFRRGPVGEIRRVPAFRSGGGRGAADDGDREPETADDWSDGEEMPEPQTPEERVAAAWDALVERFRDVGEDGAGGPTAEDAAAFKAAFDAFSPEQKLERVAEAQNLLPDASIACLAAIMRDAREPTDVLESLLHDVLNRAEGVKAPLIREVARMDGHPLAGECRELLDALGD